MTTKHKKHPTEPGKLGAWLHGELTATSVPSKAAPINKGPKKCCPIEELESWMIGITEFVDSLVKQGFHFDDVMAIIHSVVDSFDWTSGDWMSCLCACKSACKQQLIPEVPGSVTHYVPPTKGVRGKRFGA